MKGAGCSQNSPPRNQMWHWNHRCFGNVNLLGVGIWIEIWLPKNLCGVFEWGLSWKWFFRTASYEKLSIHSFGAFVRSNFPLKIVTENNNQTIQPQNSMKSWKEQRRGWTRALLLKLNEWTWRRKHSCITSSYGLSLRYKTLTITTGINEYVLSKNVGVSRMCEFKKHNWAASYIRSWTISTTLNSLHFSCVFLLRRFNFQIVLVFRYCSKHCNDTITFIVYEIFT